MDTDARSGDAHSDEEASKIMAAVERVLQADPKLHALVYWEDWEGARVDLKEVLKTKLGFEDYKSLAQVREARKASGGYHPRQRSRTMPPPLPPVCG